MEAEEPISVLLAGPDFGRWSELLALIRTAFAHMDGVIDPPSSMHRLDERALGEKAACETAIVALADDDIVGCAFLDDRGDRFYLGKLAVSPTHQRRGIGRLLMARCEALARDAGKTLIELQTRVELIGNQQAFARLGFVETGRTSHEGYYRPTSVTMRKALA